MGVTKASTHDSTTKEPVFAEAESLLINSLENLQVSFLFESLSMPSYVKRFGIGDAFVS